MVHNSVCNFWRGQSCSPLPNRCQPTATASWTRRRARTIAQLHAYAYGLSENAVWIHLYGGNRLEAQLPDGTPISLLQKTDYPWAGKVTLSFVKALEREMALRLRIRGWADLARIKVNGKRSGSEAQPGSYGELRRRWAVGDTVELDLPMPIVLMESHPLVEESRNHLAVMRGPLVYCLEAVDLPPGANIGQVRLPREAQWKTHHESGLLHGVTLLETQARLLPPSTTPPSLYRRATPSPAQAIPLRLIPYYAWCNRGEAEIAVWLPAL